MRAPVVCIFQAKMLLKELVALLQKIVYRFGAVFAFVLIFAFVKYISKPLGNQVASVVPARYHYPMQEVKQSKFVSLLNFGGWPYYLLGLFGNSKYCALRVNVKSLAEMVDYENGHHFSARCELSPFFMLKSCQELFGVGV